MVQELLLGLTGTALLENVPFECYFGINSWLLGLKELLLSRLQTAQLEIKLGIKARKCPARRDIMIGHVTFWPDLQKNFCF